jgi:hypothetical protein
MIVVELGIPELTTEQIETLCSTAEEAARKYVLSKVSNKDVKTKNIDADALVKEAVNQAHKTIEKFLRKIR